MAIWVKVFFRMCFKGDRQVYNGNSLLISVSPNMHYLSFNLLSFFQIL